MRDLDSQDVYRVVKKLVGEIEPVGSSHIDDIYYNNLEVMIDLVEALLGDLLKVARYKENYEDSMKKAGIKADEFIQETCHILIEE